MATVNTRVIIVGGSPIIGAALEALLQSAGYHALFFGESAITELNEELADCQLLIVAPPLSAERRQVLLDMVQSPETSVEIPILELLAANGERQHFRGGRVVLWPCSLEELKQTIEAALRAQR